MNLNRAETMAKGLIKKLEPFCDRMEIVGDIRRRKPDIDNIDILLAPKSTELFGLMMKLVELGSTDGMRVSNKKILILKDDFGEIKTNLWFTPLDDWSVMLLIKTGGSRTIKKIEKLCDSKKLALSVSNGIIYDENGRKIPFEKEEDIFKLLEIPFIEASWRE